MSTQDDHPCCGDRKWWSPSYIGDYITVVVLLVLSVILMVSVTPYHMYLPSVSVTVAVADSQGKAHNTTLNIPIQEGVFYPKVKQTVPTVLMGVILVVMSAISVLFVQVLRCLLKSRRWPIIHDIHNFVLGILEAEALGLFIVNVLKPFAGRHRPSYYAMIAADSKEDRESRVSYPSGHTQTAFSGFFFVTLFILGKLRVLSPSGNIRGFPTFLRLFLAMLPTLCSYLIAITRTRDYMHNFSDINAGAFIGVITATLAYHCVYPPLTSPLCHLPRSRNYERSIYEASGKKDDQSSSKVELSDVVVSDA